MVTTTTQLRDTTDQPLTITLVGRMWKEGKRKGSREAAKDGGIGREEDAKREEIKKNR